MPAVAREAASFYQRVVPEKHFRHSTLITRISKCADACVEFEFCPSDRDVEYQVTLMLRIWSLSPEGDLLILLGVHCCCAGSTSREFSGNVICTQCDPLLRLGHRMYQRELYYPFCVHVDKQRDVDWQRFIGIGSTATHKPMNRVRAA